MSRIGIIAGLFWCWVCSTCFGQEHKAPNTKLAKYHVKAERFVFVSDHVLYIDKDTVLYYPDSVDVEIHKHEMTSSDTFYKNVKEKMSKTKASKVVYDFLFRNPAAKDKKSSEKMNELRFISYKGDEISALDYKHLAIFGSKMQDTAYLKVDPYTNLLNKAHVNTRRWIIRKNLPFRKGDAISPEAMVEAERLLRRLPYVKNARVMVKPAQESEAASVAVVTRDVFPYSVEIDPDNDNNALFGISHINIGGIGHELEYNYIDRGDYELYYRVRSMFGTYIDLELNDSDHFLKTGNGISLTRDFVTPETKYAGGFEHNAYDFGDQNYDPITDTRSEFFYKRDRYDLWLGRSFKTDFRWRRLGFGEDTYVVTSARYDFQDYFDRPIVTADTNYRYQDRRNILFSAGLSSRAYYKDRFITNYGRTEDIPVGSVLSAVIGGQRREFQRRVYLGTRYASGGYFPFGYVNGALAVGGFVETGGVRDGVFRGDLDYFSPLLTFYGFRFRQFITLSFSQTIRPTEDIILRTQNDLGIRGISGYFLRSTQKVNTKIESVLFTPARFFGFKLAVFGFLDYTVTGDSQSEFFNAEQFMGLGGGFRLRNDNLAFSTIQVRMGYYPSLPINSQPNTVDLATSTSITISDFDMGAPEFVPFR